jgi:DNA-binding response OmpR family regulator
MSGSWWSLRERDSLVDDPEPAPRPELLCVTEDPETVDAVRELVAPRVVCRAASSCREARVLFRAHHPSLVLADDRLCEDSGLDLLRELKAEVPRTVCVLMTRAGGDRALLIRALNEPGLIHRCVERPFDPAALRVELLRCCAARDETVVPRAGFLGC